MDEKKVCEQIRKNLLKKHGQLAEAEDTKQATKSLLGKRKADQLDSLHTVK